MKSYYLYLLKFIEDNEKSIADVKKSFRPAPLDCDKLRFRGFMESQKNCEVKFCDDLPHKDFVYKNVTTITINKDFKLFKNTRHRHHDTKIWVPRDSVFNILTAIFGPSFRINLTNGADILIRFTLFHSGHEREFDFIGDNVSPLIPAWSDDPFVKTNLTPYSSVSDPLPDSFIPASVALDNLLMEYVNGAYEETKETV